MPRKVIIVKFTYPMELDTLNYIIETYEDNIERLYEIGIGNKTEFRTVVTEKIIDNLISRMNQLKARRVNLLKY